MEHVEYTVSADRPYIYAVFTDERNARDYYTDMLVRYPDAEIEFNVKQK